MKRLLSFVLALTLLSCDKEVDLDDVLSGLTISPRKLEADGQSTAEAKVILAKETSPDRRTVIFTTNRGVFSISGKNKETVKAEFIAGTLVARASLRVPLQPGILKISAQPEYDSPIRDYILMDSIELMPANPVAFTLEPTRFGLGTNFSSEVRLLGTLRNKNNGYASRNNTVLFEDLLPNGSPANGRFSNRKAQSNDTSRVRTFYATGAYPIGTTIKIRGTVLNANGDKTSVADSILLTVNM